MVKLPTPKPLPEAAPRVAPVQHRPDVYVYPAATPGLLAVATPWKPAEADYANDRDAAQIALGRAKGLRWQGAIPLPADIGETKTAAKAGAKPFAVSKATGRPVGEWSGAPDHIGAWLERLEAKGWRILASEDREAAIRALEMASRVAPVIGKAKAPVDVAAAASVLAKFGR